MTSETLSPPDDARAPERTQFLQLAGWGDAQRQPLAMDASTRRYERLVRGSETAIFMDAPPNDESPPCPPNATVEERKALGWNAVSRLAACRVDAFVGLSDHLLALGLSSPRILSFNVLKGFALIEDLGRRVYARELEAGADEGLLYAVATDALAHVHNQPAPSVVGEGEDAWPILDYDALAFASGADLFREWYIYVDERFSFSEQQSDRWSKLIAEYSAELESLPNVLLLRDYHAENLIWMPERIGYGRVGILDFQDAIAGPAAWDIAMFLQDARRDIDAGVFEQCYRQYLDAVGRTDDTFSGELAIAGALNVLRILGLFARLMHRDRKPRYGAFMPRLGWYLHQNLKHPRMADMKALIDDISPGAF